MCRKHWLRVGLVISLGLLAATLLSRSPEQGQPDVISTLSASLGHSPRQDDPFAVGDISADRALTENDQVAALGELEQPSTTEDHSSAIDASTGYDKREETARTTRARVAYVASKLRAPFHYPSCEWAARISPSNLQTFRTREEAIAAGHRPCKVCRP